jgi:hypothetical protein
MGVDFAVALIQNSSVKEQRSRISLTRQSRSWARDSRFVAPVRDIYNPLTGLVFESSIRTAEMVNMRAMHSTRSDGFCQ